MNRLRYVTRFALVLLFLAFVATTALAQVQNGTITGDVTDPSGAAVPNVQVTAVNTQTGLSLTATGNQTGHFVVNQAPPGTYKLTVTGPGFKTYSRANVPVNAGTIQHLDVKLQVGQVTETVEVTGAPPQIDVETSRLAQVVTGAQVANLPLNGRNVYDLIQLAPGAVNTRGVLTEEGVGTVVNGLRQNFNGFLINGVSNKGLSGAAVSTPIQDTVQEFQELTLNMSAQYGNSAGSVTNLVTKSGTNDFHGSAWWFGRNDIFDANQFFLNHEGVDKQPLRFNQYGGTFGGPIVPNKLFFFLSFQDNKFRESSPPTAVQVESPEFRQAVLQAFPNSVAALLYGRFSPTVTGSPSITLEEYVNGGEFSGSGFSSFGEYLCPDNTNVAVAGRFASLFGVTAADQAAMSSAGCSTIPGIQPGILSRTAPFLYDTISFNGSQNQPALGTGNLFNGWETSARIDFNATNNDRLFGQINWTRQDDRFGFPNTTSNSNGRGAAFLNPIRNKYPNFQFSYVHTFSPTVLNEFRAGYVGNIENVTVAEPGIPDIRFDDGVMGFGSYSGYPQVFHENIYSYSDMVSLSKGKHNIKIGADLRRNIENSEFSVARPSYYFFDALFFAADAPYTQTAGVDPGIVEGRPAQLASNVRHWRNWEVGAYIQDDWKITRNLTLNLGLRYDFYQRHNELNDLETTFIKGPGQNIIDDITTGAGQIRDTNVPAGLPGCDTPQQIAQAQLAGICGPGGFAATDGLGKGDHNNFGPRVGFAWDMFGTGRSSLRGGFGVSYEGTLYNPLSNSRWNLPYYSFNNATNSLGGDVQNVVYGPTICGPAGGCVPNPAGIPTFSGEPLNPFMGFGAQAAGNLTGWDPLNPNLANLTGIVFPEGIKDPYVYNYFLGWQHEIIPNTVFELNYVGTTGHKLFRAQNVNRIPGGRLPPGTCTTDNFGRRLCSQIDAAETVNPAGRLNPNFGTLRVWENVVNSNYNALQASLRRQLTSGVSFNINYTWSHAIDAGSTWHSGATSSNGPAAGEGYTTDVTRPNIDRGNSIFDVRHRLVANFVWELPWLKSQQGFLGRLLGGWQWNGIFSYQTGAHWSPFDRRQGGFPVGSLENALGDPCTQGDIDAGQCFNTGGDYNLDGERNDRPNAVADNFDPSDAQWADGWGGVFAPGGGFFSAPCVGCVGNLRRNTFVGPNFWNFDTSLFKNIRITERVNLQFRAESFNVFNHTNFQLPGAGGATNNQVNRANFGQAGGAFNPRNLQFGLKLNF